MKILVEYFDIESAWSALKAIEYRNPAQCKNFQDALDILTKILLANSNPDSTDCRLDKNDSINFIGEKGKQDYIIEDDIDWENVLILDDEI